MLYLNKKLPDLKKVKMSLIIHIQNVQDIINQLSYQQPGKSQLNYEEATNTNTEMNQMWIYLTKIF